ncbi:MAG: endonuclease III [Actinomycetaceae bacterium]|nr:endonuclease III [Actinomycetaceae bacterium]
MAQNKKTNSLPKRPRTLKERKKAALTIANELASIYPDSHCALNFTNPFELLVATVLSAQTTDKRVNSVTGELFSRYPTPKNMSQARQEDVENILHSLGFFRAKARSCINLSKQLCAEHEGNVPSTLEELIRLPGVGRKTANVVLGNTFDIPGITVDTHVGRLARRWAWTRHSDPAKAEKDIAHLLPKEIWTITCHRIIDHGRAVCHSRNPECPTCPLQKICPSADIY